MAFHFPLMPRMFMAVRQEDRHPIVEILRQTPDIPDNCQWAMFLRNHDELTLEMVTDEERDYMYRSYAADPQMRINVGIRRRLAPLLENSRRRIELLNGLLFSMPGTPVLYYGDEIGMGDNIYLGDRNGVRTPMQWTGDRNGGFSRADPAQLYAPPIMDPVYGYQAINVEAQERAPFSLLNWMKRMIGLRKQFTVFGRGSLEFLPATNRKVLAFVRALGDEVVMCVANLARTVQPVELDLSRFKGMTPVEMLGLTEFPRIGDLPYFLTLPGYSFYWFRLQQAPSPIAARVVQESVPGLAEMPALFVGAAWDTVLEGNVRTLIERDLLTPFLQRQRWFGGKAREPRASRFVDWGLLRRGPQPLFLTVVAPRRARAAAVPGREARPGARAAARGGRGPAGPGLRRRRAAAPHSSRSPAAAPAPHSWSSPGSSWHAGAARARSEPGPEGAPSIPWLGMATAQRSLQRGELRVLAILGVPTFALALAITTVSTYCRFLPRTSRIPRSSSACSSAARASWPVAAARRRRVFGPAAHAAGQPPADHHRRDAALHPSRWRWSASSPRSPKRPIVLALFFAASSSPRALPGALPRPGRRRDRRARAEQPSDLPRGRDVPGAGRRRAADLDLRPLPFLAAAWWSP